MVTGLSGAIIAAGRGERLRNATNNLPKPLVEVGGEPLLIRQANAMMTLGLKPVHAIVNSETSAIMAERRIELPASVDLSVRDTTSSMESLFALAPRITSKRFVLATVDAVLPQREFEHFVALALDQTNKAGAQHRDGALGVVRWRGDRHPLFAEVAEDGLIFGLGSRQTGWVTAGVYLLPASIFQHAEEARARGLDALRRFLALLIEKGMRLAAVELSGVIDVDEGEDLRAARSMIERS